MTDATTYGRRLTLSMLGSFRFSCALCLPGRVLGESLLLPPSGNGDADGRSIVFLDEVGAGADMLDLEGGDVILAPPDGRGSHDRARIEGGQELGRLGRAREPGVVCLDPLHDVGGPAL